MRKAILAIFLAAATASTANAATIVIVTDPMTFERHTIIVKSTGPHRVLMCMAPPSTSGCTEMPVKRVRR